MIFEHILSIIFLNEPKFILLHTYPHILVYFKYCYVSLTF